MASVSAAGGADLAMVDVVPAEFYDRPVLEVAHELIGCVVEHDGCRADRRDRGLPRERARVSRLRRPDAAHATLFGQPGPHTCIAPTASTPC